MVFDPYGAYVAGLFFIGVLLFLTLIFAINLRKPHLGWMRLSRKVRIIGFTTLAMLYLSTVYGWLFARRFYEIHVTAGGSEVELVFLVPRRFVRLESDGVEVSTVPSPRGSGRRLQVANPSGKRYRSPELSQRDASQLLIRLEKELLGNSQTPAKAEEE